MHKADLEIKQSVSIKGLQMEQSITLPDRNDILNLTKIPSTYLIQELQSRGELVVEGRVSAYELASKLLKLFKGSDVCHEVSKLITKAALEESYGVQAEAAKLLGISTRVISYRINKVYLLGGINGENFKRKERWYRTPQKLLPIQNEETRQEETPR